LTTLVVVTNEPQEDKVKRFSSSIHYGSLLFVLVLALPGFAQNNPPGPATGPPQIGAATKKFSPPPPNQKIPVAFVLSEGATMIDFAGPWEVFQDVRLEPNPDSPSPFQPYTVAESRDPIHTSAGMIVVPTYTFEDAPAPRVVVVPASHNGTPKMEEWLRRMHAQSDVVMSVCTGVYWLIDAGLLDGKKYTTNHNAYDRFQEAFPKAALVKDQRWVQSDDVIYTAAGLTSGIDLALHVVEKYYGREIAVKTVKYMEYESPRWTTKP
jgi:transcriptional regulator GlxA family with amidase domain